MKRLLANTAISPCKQTSQQSASATSLQGPCCVRVGVARGGHAVTPCASKSGARRGEKQPRRRRGSTEQQQQHDHMQLATPMPPYPPVSVVHPRIHTSDNGDCHQKGQQPIQQPSLRLLHEDQLRATLDAVHSTDAVILASMARGGAPPSEVHARRMLSFFLRTAMAKQDFPVGTWPVEAAPSRLPGAGLGLFATRYVPKGTVLTTYPCHTLTCPAPPDDDGLGDGGGMGGRSRRRRQQEQVLRWAEDGGSWLDPHEVPTPDRSYGIEADAVSGVVIYGDPGLPGPDVHVGAAGHLINDPCTDTEAVGVRRGEEPQEAARRLLRYVGMCAAAMNCRHRRYKDCVYSVAVRDVAAGEELLVPYGFHYWNGQLGVSTGELAELVGQGLEGLSVEERGLENGEGNAMDFLRAIEG